MLLYVHMLFHRRYKKILLLSALVMIVTAMAMIIQSHPTFAQSKPGDVTNLYGLVSSARESSLDSSRASLPELVGTIIKTLLGLTGVLFLGMVVVAGDFWITAGGNEKQVEQAQTMIKNGVTGIIIVFAAYALTTFVIDQVLSYAGL